MYKGCFVFCLISLATLCARPQPSLGATAGQLVVCGWDELFILDIGNSAPKKVWTWKAVNRPELPAPMRSKFRTIDECKPVAGGSRILITASSEGVALIERTTGRVEFYATAVNAHSAELLPGGRIAVAASHADPRSGKPGDRLILFDRSRSGVELFSTELPSGHGLVWDVARQVLWALSGRDLRLYRLDKWDTTAPSLIKAATWELPDSSGHDLQPVPGTAMLSVTTGRHCWYFDRDAKKFLPHPQLSDRAGVKCITVNPTTGQIVWVLSEGGNWWTDKLRFLRPERTIQLPGERLYKARWLPAPASGN